MLTEASTQRLLDAGRSLVSELALERVLERLLDTARELTGARYAAIGVLNRERHVLEQFLTVGIDEATQAEIGDLPHGRGVLGLLIEHPEPLVLDDVSAHPRSYGFPAGHPRMKTFLGVPLMIRGAAWGNVYLADKRGGGFDDEDVQSVTVLAEWASIAIEHAQAFESLADRTIELQRAVEALEATTTIARAVGSETDLDRVLELIVKRGRALVRARAVVLLLLEGDHLVAAAGAGQVDDATLSAALSVESSVAGEVLRRGTPERILDVAVRLAVEDERIGIVGAETALLVPLRYREHALGVLCAFDRLDDDPEFGDRDELLLEAFAASAATAVATAQTVEADRLRHSLRSAEQERRRWARELHDETLQGLAALGVVLSAGQRAGGEALEQAVSQATEQLTTEIANLRALITELRPAALDQLGLVAALEGLAPPRARGRGAGARPPRRRRRVGARRRAQDRDLPARAGGAHERRQARVGRPGRGQREPPGRRGAPARRRRRRRVRCGRADRGLRPGRHARAGGADGRHARRLQLAPRHRRQRALQRLSVRPWPGRGSPTPARRAGRARGGRPDTGRGAARRSSPAATTGSRSTPRSGRRARAAGTGSRRR